VGDAPGLGWRLRAALRPLRRTTLIGPLQDAWLVRDILRRLPSTPGHDQVLAPDEFASYVRQQTTLSPDRAYPGTLTYRYVIVRQDQLNALDPDLLAALRASYGCIHANRRFALFESAAPSSRVGASVVARLDGLAGAHKAAAPPRVVAPGARDRAILVTTYNRPSALARSLPQLTALGHVVLVVDDGSAAAARARNGAIAARCGAACLEFPENRGLCASLNAGLAYLMADRAIEWISYFQDDVDVDPLVMAALQLVEDRVQRPIVTGYDAGEHPAERETTIGGWRVKLKRSSPAVHLHAHVDYWRGVLPIPTEYLGAPRRRWDASLDDYWIINNAPGSAEKRGVLVACVPDLVRTFLWDHADSTWGNPNDPDPPLAADLDKAGALRT
jgi:hypothetical protein